MLMNLLEYNWAEDLDEALILLGRTDVKTVALAGGTSLLGRDDETIQAVVDLRDLELAYTEEDARNGQALLRVGAMTTLQTLADAPLLREGAASVLADVERRLDVLLRGQRGDEVERLVDHADLGVAHLGKLALAHLRDVNPINQHLAGRGIIQSGDDAEQGGFARARGANHGDKLAMIDAHGDALEDINTLAAQRQRLVNVNGFERGGRCGNSDAMRRAFGGVHGLNAFLSTSSAERVGASCAAQSSARRQDAPEGVRLSQVAVAIRRRCRIRAEFPFAPPIGYHICGTGRNASAVGRIGHETTQPSVGSTALRQVSDLIATGLRQFAHMRCSDGAGLGTTR